MLEPTIAPTVSEIVSARVTPPIVIASASNVPSISASPLISSVAASSSPVKVTFLNPVISLFESAITASEADTVPAVIPSNKFNSVAVEVTATSSFILGDVKVLFVSVAVEAVDTKSTLPPVLGSVKTFDALCA